MTIINAVTLHTVTINWVKCILDIKVVLNTYDTDDQCYDISYKWTFEDNKRKYNPFYNDSDFMENSTAGEIVYKNCLTDALVSCLVMSDEELEVYEQHMETIYRTGKKSVDCILSKKEDLIKNSAAGVSNLEVINGCFSNFNIKELVMSKIPGLDKIPELDKITL